MVPKDCREVLGRSKWTEPGGTLNQARAKVPSFLARTDVEIRAARGEQISPEESLIRQGQQPMDPHEMVTQAARGLSDYIEVDGQWVENPEFVRLYELAQSVQKGKTKELLSTDSLLTIRRLDREPSPRTFEGWDKALRAFMAHSGKARPGLCTKADALAYKDYLLARMSRNSAKTQVAYLSGLWTTLVEREGCEHIFKGLPKTLTATTKQAALQETEAKRNRSFEPTTPIGEWEGSAYVDVFKLLYYTGCRLGEIAGLSGEDIHEDFISVAWSDERSLKTAHSVRDIPIHQELTACIENLRGKKGLIWPQLRTTSEVGGIEVVRWGHNLSKPCRKVTGLKPKDFRDRFATQLREHDFNQVNIERLMGHSAVDTNSSYGGRNWDRYVAMINSIS
ncbi:Phage integrase [Synechococcus sp. RS9916]|nr:Phage integrase [Synechococcus sp. RS9916]